MKILQVIEIQFLSLRDSLIAQHLAMLLNWPMSDPSSQMSSFQIPQLGEPRANSEKAGSPNVAFHSQVSIVEREREALMTMYTQLTYRYNSPKGILDLYTLNNLIPKVHLVSLLNH